MADRITIARPYARAAFEEARAHERLAPWSEALQVAAEVVRDPRVQTLLGNPRVTPEQLAQLVSGIAAAPLGDHGANFVRTLAVNRRLAYLPEISALFNTLKDAAEGVADVTVTSAAALDASQQRKLAAALGYSRSSHSACFSIRTMPSFADSRKAARRTAFTCSFNSSGK